MQAHDSSVEASEADLIDQDIPVVHDEDADALDTAVLDDANPVDVVEQHRTVVLDEDHT